MLQLPGDEEMGHLRRLNARLIGEVAGLKRQLAAAAAGSGPASLNDEQPV